MKSQLRVLVVDDNTDTRGGVIATLRAVGVNEQNISTAGDGQEALELLLRGLQVDIVISDVDMPRMNGIDLAKQLIANKVVVPFILITGDTTTAKDAPIGFVKGILQKPVPKDVLDVMLSTVIDRKVENAPTIPGPVS